MNKMNDNHIWHLYNGDKELGWIKKEGKSWERVVPLTKIEELMGKETAMKLFPEHYKDETNLDQAHYLGDE